MTARRERRVLEYLCGRHQHPARPVELPPVLFRRGHERAEDCSKPAGNNKGGTTCHLLNNAVTPCINDWIFEGLAGRGKVLGCTNSNGFAPVTYKYTVTNNTS